MFLTFNQYKLGESPKYRDEPDLEWSITEAEEEDNPLLSFLFNLRVKANCFHNRKQFEVTHRRK